MKRVLAIIIAILLFVVFAMAFAKIPFGEQMSKYPHYYNPIENQTSNMSLPQHYLTYGKKDTGATNMVTAVVVDYRGFDTLGEVTVLFLASTGVGSLMYVENKAKKKVKRSNAVVETGSKLLFGFIILFGAYIFIHGHLTPGGGFPGGAIIASSFLLLYLAYPKFHAEHKRLNVSESLAGLTFVIVGLLGLAIAGYFLYNFLPFGLPTYLFSAGVIPVIYVAIGVKVGSELTGIVDAMMGVRE
ncbi:Na(+)/H(+) antiporter subunit B [Candidatus Aciduliprofundum boonei]|uniref:Na+/H+ antiporter MnhB subunit-related protein n=1 Tax=Aciduliprofundum boonei (strain DSM 19572 / T469) TaxID=439481 RepID=B5IAP1_ACIB4|nr:Na(+)/H(+) antiporter subunit B [Candidatus Aciduliprofundum boonei]ADD08193.1 Na+/H+ antiporter MnhB subunit-related protein [Aciduliprofundum boonei T469]EDY36957.1 Na+/H+ antiporter family domain protein [Aciduliprofundum boonei T469]HII54567.1 cation:proton antiporter [Candidatus Aciduliprofundum boonei]